MYEAARIDDQIAHSNWGWALVGGIVAGVVVGAAVVASGGTALIVLAAAGFAGGAASSAIGSYHSFDGPIKTGAARTKIGGMAAARAIVDKVGCHMPEVIAQGSKTVAIEDQPAARISDETQCGGKVGQGCANVFIGREPETYVKIRNEVPWYIRFALGLGQVVGGARATRQQFANPRCYFKGLTAKQPNIFNKNFSWRQKTAGHPVDVGTGAVVDFATDFTLSGLIPIQWKRTYNSHQASEENGLGVGGWALDWEQWVEEDGDLWTLRREEGRDIYFEKVGVGETTFHTRDRLTLHVNEGGQFTIYDHATKMTSFFAPAEDGSRSATRALLQRIEDPHGNAVRLFYEGRHLHRVEDTAGRQIQIRRNREQRITRVEVASQNNVTLWVDYAYHPSGELASTTDALGHTDQFEYDSSHRMTKITLKNGVAFQYAYCEESGRCIKTWGDNGLHSVAFEYDLDLGRTITSGTPEPRRYYWDDTGLVRYEETLSRQPLDVCEVDDRSQVIAEGPTETSVTKYEYDERGNRTKAIDPAGSITTWAYDGDLPTSRTDPDGLVTQFVHDDNAALVGITAPTGIQYKLGRDAHGRLTSVVEGDRTMATFTYDSEHNVVAETDARGAVTLYEYDPLGRLLGRKDALGRVWQIERDILGRPMEICAPDGTTIHAEHDVLGNVTRTVDALGQITTMAYAGTGVLTQLTQPNGQSYSITYDTKERVTSIQNPLGEQYSYEYDEAGRVVSERTFDGRKFSYRYGDDGTLSAIDYPDTSFRMFRRDKRGLLTADIALGSEIQLTRDPLGRVTEAVLSERSGKQVVTLKRDELGRVVEERQNERTVQYSYDQRGRRTERKLPDGTVSRYTFDEADDLASIEHAGRALNLTRDILGREISRKSGPSFNVKNAYDDMDRLIGQVTMGGAAHDILSKRTWAYDPLGRARETTDTRWGNTVYMHDAIGQLLTAQRGAYKEAFSYDPAGSLKKLTDELSGADMAGDWNIQSGNRLVRTPEAEYTHDRRGRRIRKVNFQETSGERPGEVTEYTWDARDRLREVKKSSGERVLFTYDALGRRARKEVLPASGQGKSRVTEFLWDGDELAADIDTDRGTRTFAHDPGTFVPLLQGEQGEVLAVVNDHLGMPKELVDAEGRVAWSAAHSAFGQVVEEYRDAFTKRAHRVESPFRLLGQYADAETGLCHTKFRYFDPAIGRWCSPDPLGIDGGLNLLAFDGSPLEVVDPLGLAACPTKTSRRKALTAQKDALGIPRSQQPSKSWTVHDPAKVKGSGIRDPNPRNQGRIYEYELPKPGGGYRKVYIADHRNDPLHGGIGHVHQGLPKPGATSVEPGGRYMEVGNYVVYWSR